MKKIIGVSSFIIVMLVSFIGITYSYEYSEDDSIMFNINGPYELTLNLGDQYVEYGVLVFRNGIDVSSSIDIDSSSLDTSKVGEYKVKYSLIENGNEEYIYRKVIVRENVKPEIKLLGDEIMYISLDGNFIEPGYIVMDNYDTDLDSKVIITSNLVIDKIGEYKIEYKVVDSSNNEAKAVRTVIVK